jgi:hypothetical protein
MKRVFNEGDHSLEEWYSGSEDIKEFPCCIHSHWNMNMLKAYVKTAVYTHIALTLIAAFLCSCKSSAPKNLTDRPDGFTSQQ